MKRPSWPARLDPRDRASYGGPGVFSQIVARLDHCEKFAHFRARSGSGFERSLAIGCPAPICAILHVEPLRYFVDDGRGDADPVGNPRHMLGVEACIVPAPADAMKRCSACVRQAGAEIEDIIPGPSRPGFPGLTEEERDDGALLLDLGAGGVGISVFAAEGSSIAKPCRAAACA